MWLYTLVPKTYFESNKCSDLFLKSLLQQSFLIFENHCPLTSKNKYHILLSCFFLCLLFIFFSSLSSLLYILYLLSPFSYSICDSLSFQLSFSCWTYIHVIQRATRETCPPFETCDERDPVWQLQKCSLPQEGFLQECI